MPQNDPRPASSRLLALAAIVTAGVWLWALWPSAHELVVTFIDVGQGDSILIETPRGYVVLIDAGRPGEDGRDAGNRIVAPLLRRKGIDVIDLLVLTHPHEDHVGGMLSILQQFRVKHFATTGVDDASDIYRDVLRAVEKRKIPVVRVHKGVKVNFPDGVTLAFLHPDESDIPRRIVEDSELNHLSAVSKLEYGEARVLLEADADSEAEAKMLARGVDPRAAVLKVSHHGSSSATTGAFLHAVNPRIAVISVGRWNEFGHPSRETLARLKRAGVRTYRTDLDGTVTIETDGQRIRIRQSRLPSWLRGGSGFRVADIALRVPPGPEANGAYAGFETRASRDDKAEAQLRLRLGISGRDPSQLDFIHLSSMKK